MLICTNFVDAQTNIKPIKCNDSKITSDSIENLSFENNIVISFKLNALGRIPSKLINQEEKSMF